MPKCCCASWPRSSARAEHDRSHAPRGNACGDALRHDFKSGRRASKAAFPRRAWERSGLTSFSSASNTWSTPGTRSPAPGCP
ncbi:DUF1534 domain-containing protein [Pseudomonas tolaasii]|nr:DUF1534 domain-containing protein [Pseudomonas tolaasii]